MELSGDTEFRKNDFLPPDSSPQEASAERKKLVSEGSMEEVVYDAIGDLFAAGSSLGMDSFSPCPLTTYAPSGEYSAWVAGAVVGVDHATVGLADEISYIRSPPSPAAPPTSNSYGFVG